MAMQEFERRKLRTQLFEQAPHAKIALSYVCIVKQHNRALGQLWSPRIEIMPDRFISVQAVYVQKVHRGVSQIRQCVIKGAAQEFRKGAVALVMETAQIPVDLLPV